MLFGIIFLFAITGIYNIQNVFAIENPDYTETIPPGYKIYFDFDLNEGDKIRIDFEVIAGGNKDVDFYILDSEGLYVEGFEKQRYIKGTFYLIAPYDDIFSVYFSNSFSLITSKTIEIRFNIVEYGKSIIIYSPKTNDVFDNGYNYITWLTTGTINYVRIELYYGNSFLEVIDSSESNDGSYSWYLGSGDVYTLSSNYRIRISDYYDDSVYAFSNYFMIEIDPYVPYDNPIENIFWNILITIVATILVIAIPIILIRKRKRKTPEEVIIIQKEVPKIYCSECGAEILEGKLFCSKCGTKI